MTASFPKDLAEIDISVVLPCYNCGKTLPRTLASVLSQAGPAFEVIAVNDGSTDDTAAVLARHAPRVRTIHVSNGGACRARNAGLAAARGTFVLFLDADDELSPDFLRLCVATGRREAADIVLLDQHRVRPGRPPRPKSLAGVDLAPRALFSRWLRGHQVNPASVCWRRAFVLQIGGWNPEVLINQDGEIMLRAFLADPQISHALGAHSIYHVGNPSSLSGRKSAEKLDNYIDTLTRLAEMAEAQGFDPGALEVEIYGVCRMCFRMGYAEIGRRGVRLLKGRGAYRHHGSLQHRLAATLLGLEGKVKLLRT